MSIIITILSFLLTLGILITFHEWGHFIVARKLGVKVLRFSIGFGKPIWSYHAKDGTQYCVAAIPLGGYVKMLDEHEGEVPVAEQKFAFNRKPVWTRIAIVLAGPLANFLFAMIAFALVYSIGIRDFAPIVDTVTPGSVAQQIGFQVQDEVIAVNHVTTASQQSVRRIFLAEEHPQSYTFTLKRSDSLYTAILPSSDIKGSPLDEQFFTELGFSLGAPAFIGDIEIDSPAARAGLQPGDHIIAVNEQAIHSWFEFVKQISEYPGKEVTLTLVRQQQQLELPITPGTKMHEGLAIGYIGVAIDKHLLRLTREPMGQALMHGVRDTWFYTVLTFDSIGKMLVGQIGLEHLSGPISIAIYAGHSAQIGLVYFLQFLAFVSISLGVINLLPIPMLDGGHLLYYVAEAIMRKPLSLKIQQIGLSIGLLLLVSLMVLAFYNDVIQLGSR
jgi:regulator of sigma E protease